MPGERMPGIDHAAKSGEAGSCWGGQAGVGEVKHQSWGERISKAWDVAQEVKHLLGRNEKLGSDPQYPHNTHVVSCTSSNRAGATKTGESGIFWTPSLWEIASKVE